MEDVRAFEVHLVSTGISWPALNQTVCALRLFYGVTLGHARFRSVRERDAHAIAPLGRQARRDPRHEMIFGRDAVWDADAGERPWVWEEERPVGRRIPPMAIVGPNDAIEQAGARPAAASRT